MKKPKTNRNTEIARQRELAARSRLDAYEKAIGGSKDLRRLTALYGTLLLASDPTPAQKLDSSSRPSQWDRPQPGSATRSFRGLLKRMDRGISRLADQLEAGLNDPSWRPPRGGRCADCGLLGRVGDKFCGSCSGELVSGGT